MCSNNTLVCLPSTFSNISFYGAEIVSVEATLVTGYNASVPAGYRFTQPSIEVENASFCNVTVSYTHPGQGDLINVEAWLPDKGWNHRLQAVGGGGWSAGRTDVQYIAMGGAIGDGYATASTDAGLGDANEAARWGLVSPGNVNLFNLQNLASVSLEDEAIITKAVIKAYYGKEPEYSYWNGCSQGGRQGFMLAQRYPTAYDGIAAVAPAVLWTDFFAEFMWPQQFMNMYGEYPYPCELEAITARAIAACDDLDGVVDGIIIEADACLDSFDPFSMVGQTINCDAENRTMDISPVAAGVVNATWQGRLKADGQLVWPGQMPGTRLAEGIAGTDCSSGTCTGAPFPLVPDWFNIFVSRDPNFDLNNLTHEEFDELIHLSEQKYKSIVGTDDPDLSAFRKAGGKIVSYAGLADETISPRALRIYYDRIQDTTANIDDFYRHFEVPGLQHCMGGASGQPEGLFDQLRAWVEHGTAPDQTPVSVTDLQGHERGRILCAYPARIVYDRACGEEEAPECWSCMS